MFELHYTPNGAAVKDRSSIGIIFYKTKPKYELLMNSFMNESIRIPPNDPHYRAEQPCVSAPTLAYSAWCRICTGAARTISTS